MASPTGSDLHTPGPLGVPPSSANLTGKRPKADVDYRQGRAGEGTCGGCRYFNSGSCELVAGTIRASDTCVLYEPATVRASETQAFRGVGGRLTRGRGPGGKRTHGQSYYTGSSAHGPSILNPAVYEALRDKKGMDKKSAAAISNAALSKKRKGGGWYKKGRHSSGKAVKMTEQFSTPGRARALRALGAARRRNTERVARGEKPVVGGKKVDKIPGLTKKKAKQRAAAPSQATPKGEGPHGFVEFLAEHNPELLPETFFDKKSYMKTYNQQRWGSKKASMGRRKATQGLGRLNRSKKITKSNPSAASTARIARLGLKRGLLQTGTSKTGMKAFVRGFAHARKTGMARGGINKALRHHVAATERFFDKKAYMKAYNARKRGGGGGGSSLARVQGKASTPSAFKVRAKSAPAKKPRMVTRKGGLNPRARGPRTLKQTVVHGVKVPRGGRHFPPQLRSNPNRMRPGQGQYVPGRDRGGGGPD